jgi:hypothetical protein
MYGLMFRPVKLAPTKLRLTCTGKVRRGRWQGLDQGETELAPMTAPVDCSVHRMGWPFSSCSWPSVNQHGTTVNNFWLLTFGFVLGPGHLFLSPDLHTLPPCYSIHLLYIFPLPANCKKPLYLFTLYPFLAKSLSLDKMFLFLTKFLSLNKPFLLLGYNFSYQQLFSTPWINLYLSQNFFG